MKPWLWWCVDGLLALAIVLFLLPLDPRISSLPLLLWLAIQLLLAPQPRRWALWPLLALMLLSTRTWWFNDPPHPASFFDGVLFVVALLASTTVPLQRWTAVLRLPLLAGVPLLVLVGDKPWTPNPAAGSNQGAYLLGLLLLQAVVWLWQRQQRWWQRLTALAAVLINFGLVWQTGSRAALISAGVALMVVWLRERARRGRWWPDLVRLLFLSSGVYLLRWLVFSTNSSLPGFKSGSDLGRLLTAECFGGLPFTGNNRLLYGVGFERLKEFCQVPFQGLTLQHAHNLYLQIWAATGLLGMLALGLVLVLLIRSWLTVELDMPLMLRCSGQAALIYCFLQGCFDVSVMHWPITLAFSALLIGMPLAFVPALTSSAQGADRR